MRSLILTLIIAALCTIAWAWAHRCPIDNTNMYWTGQTKSDEYTGQFLKEYKCAWGHTFWLP